MVAIYVLELEQGKYYIGKTTNPEFRLESHFNSNGSEWTKKYKPIKVVELNTQCDDYDEDKYTRKYMDKYGIHNVRGGSFATIKLKKTELDILKKMSVSTNNKCFVCGNGGHFAKDCPDNWETEEEWETTSEEGDTITYSCGNCNKLLEGEDQYQKHKRTCQDKKQSSKINLNSKQYSYSKKNCCFRCGRTGHYAPDCYAATHIKGYYLD